MKKYLLPESGSFYKANLHCHSVVSDGRLTPKEIKEKYKAQGYSIVAYTDHAVMITHNDLRDENFLPLNGYELDFSQEKIQGRSSKVCHVCFVSLVEDRAVQRIFYHSRHLEKNLQEACLDPDRDYLHREYSSEFISKILEEGVNDGFFVTYNHPVWSLETKDEYCNYHGMHAMEIVNYGCVTEGYDDRNGDIYDQMLRGGEKLYCVATDDNHNKHPENDPRCDSYGGFTMIKAERLTYDDIAQALTNGHFYASEGPEIKELYFEDNKICIETSAAARIIMTTANRAYRVVTPPQKGMTLNSACFEISPNMGDYVRFTVADELGKQAYTNAYFLADLPLEV